MNDNYGETPMMQSMSNCSQSNMKANTIATPVGRARDVAEAGVILHHLRGAQDETHDVIGQLEDRLSEVLRPVPPSPLCGEKCESPTTSPLCDELGYRLSSEHSARHRILALIDRLTV